MTPRDLATIRRELAEALEIRDDAQRIVRELEDELWDAENALEATPAEPTERDS